MATFNESVEDDIVVLDAIMYPEYLFDNIDGIDIALPQRVYLYSVLDDIDVEDENMYNAIFSIQTSDNYSVSQLTVASASYGFSVSDSVSVSQDDSILRLAFFTTQDDISFSETALNSAIYNIRVNDLIRFGFVIDIMGIRYDAELETGDDYTPFQYDGFAFEANTFAASKYKGWNFNSFAKVGESYYGCADDGVYLLDGQDDAGTPIKSVLSTGQLKIAGGLQTRIAKAYLIVKNNGKLVISVAGDDSRVYNYTLAKYNEYMDEARVDIGKGLKSVVWRFEISNEGGADFEIDNFAVYPLVLTNRKK